MNESEHPAMNANQLTEALLSDDAREWPGVFRQVGWPDHEVPADLAQRMRGLIERTLEEHRARRRRVRYLGVAAAVVILLPCVIWWVSFSDRPSDLVLLQSLGSVQLVNGQGRRPSASKEHIASGETLAVAKGAEVYVRAGKGAVLRVGGPAQVKFFVSGAGPDLVLRCRIDYGSIAIRSDSGDRKEVTWEDDRGRYTMQGTIALLEVGRGRAQLHVLKGSFRALPKGISQGYPVEAGQTAVLSDSGRVVIEKLLAIDRARTGEIAENMRRVATGQKMVAGGQGFRDEQDIREFYGVLHRVYLNDGRVFLGFAAGQGRETRVHTVYGLLTVETAQVSKVVEVK